MQNYVWIKYKFPITQTRPSEPAVYPTIMKKINSERSLGRELIIKLN